MGKIIRLKNVSEGTYLKYTFVSMDNKLKCYYGVVDKKHKNQHVDVRWFNHDYHPFEQPMSYKIHIHTIASGDWELVDNLNESG